MSKLAISFRCFVDNKACWLLFGGVDHFAGFNIQSLGLVLLTGALMDQLFSRALMAACALGVTINSATAADPLIDKAPIPPGSAKPAKGATAPGTAAAPAPVVPVQVSNDALMRELRCMQQRLQQLEARTQQPAALVPAATVPSTPLIADTQPGALPPLKAPPPVTAPRADGADPNAPLPWGSAVVKSEPDPATKSGTSTVIKSTAGAPAAGAPAPAGAVKVTQAPAASECSPPGAPSAAGASDLFALKPGAAPGAPGAPAADRKSVV